MPESLEFVATESAFTAEILITQESYDVIPITSEGYQRNPIHMKGGVLLKTTISAPTMEKLQQRIAGHVTLLE